MHVAEISIYPVKGSAALPLDSAVLEARGFAGDRRWVIADPAGRFVSQREIPALARLRAMPESTGLRLRFDRSEITVLTPDRRRLRQSVSVWDSALSLPEAPEASQWLSEQFGRPLRLYHQPDDAVRQTDPAWSGPGDQVSLADGFPLLITTTAALSEIELASGLSIGMRRFRPNLVIEGAPFSADDAWTGLRIGNAVLDLVKPCARCAVTTVDQDSGTVSGDEPLATLRRTRMSGDRRVPGLLFGWNAIPRSFGLIRRGDPIEVLGYRQAWPIRPTSHFPMA